MPEEALKILVVEDDAPLRDAVCLTLEVAGHAVIGVGDGPAALAEVEKQAFNLVLSDLKMQPMDGLQLLAELRQRLPQLPVLLMTAFGDVEKAVDAMRGGACDFLMKPFEPKVLLEHVRRYAVTRPRIPRPARLRKALTTLPRIWSALYAKATRRWESAWQPIQRPTLRRSHQNQTWAT